MGTPLDEPPAQYKVQYLAQGCLKVGCFKEICSALFKKSQTSTQIAYYCRLTWMNPVTVKSASRHQY